jgi:protein gp37
MAEKTLIAWTDHTFNIAWGCVKISPGCANCYATSLASRYGHDVWGINKPRRTFGGKHWSEPLTWERDSRNGIPGVRGQGLPHLVFTSSMCDVFEDHQTIAIEREKLWPLIRSTPHLHWQVLTKRADRIAVNLPNDWGNGYPNVWIGVSIENMDYAWRADCLRDIPAAVRFISYEPALGPLDDLNLRGIDWVIYGGESGAKHRDHDIAWPRAMRQKCQACGVAFFYKQSPDRFTERGTTLDGETVRKFPTPRELVPHGLHLGNVEESERNLPVKAQ